jgi:signal transduction histidine kinase
MLDMSQEPLSTLQTAYVRRIFHSGKHLLGLINSVIEVARLEAGDVALEYSTFDTGAWYHEVIEYIVPLVSEKNLAFVAKLDSRMPSMMSGDRKYLFDMACGLLTNAIKYTDSGKVSFEIRRITTQSWIIEVADTGIGIAEEDQRFIFDLFRQADGSYSRKHGGLGIGLNLVRSLTAMMGGHITLDSRLGSGSTFRVTLPLFEEKQKTNKHVHP